TLPLLFFLPLSRAPPYPHSFPTRRSSDLLRVHGLKKRRCKQFVSLDVLSTSDALSLSSLLRSLQQLLQFYPYKERTLSHLIPHRSEEHTSELQSRFDLVCRLLLEKKNLIF